MASLINRPNGSREVQFTDANGKRRKLSLGKVPKRTADSIRTRVEYLVSAAITKQPMGDDTSRWVAGLDATLTNKLSNLGLIKARESALLGDFLRRYIDLRRNNVKPPTLFKWEATRKLLVQFFRDAQPIRDITEGRAEEFHAWLTASDKPTATKRYSQNTVRKHIARCKQFFTVARRQQLIHANPFEGLKSTMISSHDRYYFLSQDDSDRILDACPNNEWRLIFALARYGGLRIPSELSTLTWDAIDWERGRMRIVATKLEHLADGGVRYCPIFPEIRPYLDGAWQAAPPGATHVISEVHRSPKANLRTTFEKIVLRAGLVPWEKLFQNMRSSRQTELSERFPLHTVCSWLGNSPAIASRHYLQVRDAHFEEALKPALQNRAQNRAQSASDSGVLEKTDPTTNERKSLSVGRCPAWTTETMGDKGLEPLTPCL